MKNNWQSVHLSVFSDIVRPDRQADNRLLFEVKVSDILDTDDGSVLDAGCNTLYSAEWEDQMIRMVSQVNLAIEGGLCEQNMATVVTNVGIFASLGSQVSV